MATTRKRSFVSRLFRFVVFAAPVLGLGAYALAKSAPPVRGSETTWISADPDAVFALVSDVTRIGELSPETVGAEWIDGADGPAVGARFRGHVRQPNGADYWTTCTVTHHEPGTAFAFDAGLGGLTFNTWRYDLVAKNGGTEVTESFSLPDTFLTRVIWGAVGRYRGAVNHKGMRITLENLKKTLEAPSQAATAG